MAPLLIALLSTCLAAEPGSIHECVPRDVMVVYFGQPAPAAATQPATAVQQLTTWVITLKAMGIIPREGRLIADTVGLLPLLGRCPHAAMLLDVTAKPVAGSYRLNTLQAAVLIDSAGSEADIDRRVRDLLATYTDAENGRIERVEFSGAIYHRLVDRRLPEWAVIEWGNVAGRFLVGIGADAWERVAGGILAGAQQSLARDPWYAAAHARCHGATSGIELYIHLSRIHARIGEVVKGRPGAVLRALQLSEADRLLWTVGFDGRALRSEIVTRPHEGPDVYAMLTGKEVTDPRITAAIPPEAARYAAFRIPLPETVRQVREAYLNGRSPAKRARISAAWAQLEQRFGLDTDRDFIERLGGYLVVHNWPPHPLGIPLLGTIWVQYHGDRADMAAAVDRLMAACREAIIAPQTQPAATRPSRSFLLTPQLLKDESGLWYLQLGLAGPAVGVADGWIVISHSRPAVQANLAYLQRVPPISPPATAPAR